MSIEKKEYDVSVDDPSTVAYWEKRLNSEPDPPTRKIVHKDKTINYLTSSWKDLQEAEREVEEDPRPHWYDIKPFNPKNDPLYGIKPSVRWALVKDLLEKANKDNSEIQTNENIPSITDKPWERLSKKYPEIMQAQIEAISSYSGRMISLREKTHIPNGPEFPRGTRGNLLSIECLILFPDHIANAFRKAIEDHGTVLCHVQGFMVTLPVDAFRYPKS